MEATASSITTFNFAGHEPVRTSVIEGKVWFVAKDVSAILGLKCWADQVSKLEADEKGSVVTPTLGGRQSMTAVTEAGLYILIMQSRKPQAHALRKWIVSDVLPSLRAKGTYTVPSVQMPTVPTSFSAALYLAAKQAEQIEQQTAQLALAAPKVAFFDTVASSSDTTDIGTVAKVLAIPGMGRTTLFEFLRKEGVLMQNNRPYQKFVDMGLFRVIESSWTDPDGNQHVYFKSVVYQKGLEFIRQLVQVTQA
jgi:anti-repressor protein